MPAGDAWAALLLGIVEGLTEFLPISSTGHLIVAAELLGRGGEATDTFIIVIQLGAILAVCWHYRRKFASTLLTLGKRETQGFVAKVAVAFMPAALVGLAVHSHIKEHLFSPLTVAVALVVGGVVILVIEAVGTKERVTTVDGMGMREALWVGLAQVLSLFPGVSRAGATIMGGMVAGMSRPAATEFSFFLAVPIMFAAAGFDLYQGWESVADGMLPFLAVGFLAAFASALVAVRWLLAYVATRDFRPFGWYRIAVGLAVGAWALSAS